MQKNNELKVDEVFKSLDVHPRQIENKGIGPSDWADFEEDNGNVGFLETTNKEKKNKTNKNKKPVQSDVGWGQPKEAEITPPPEKVEKQEKKFRPGPKPKEPEVNITEEYFPQLGEEAPQSQGKKEEAKQETVKQSTPETKTQSGGPRFKNENKATKGENFTKLEPLAEKEPKLPTPTVVTSTVTTTATTTATITATPTVTTTTTSTDNQLTGKGFRREMGKIEAPVPEEDTGKIKFVKEGPVKFIKSGTATKTKEETKSEQDILREQKEREVEEKLRIQREKEREEMSKRQDFKKKKDEGTPKKETTEEKPFIRKGEGKPHEENKIKENHHHNNNTKEYTKEETHKSSNNEKGQGGRFTNAKKTQPIQETQEQAKPQQPETTQVETKEPETQETKMVVTKASTEGWGEGGIIKRKK